MHYIPTSRLYPPAASQRLQVRCELHDPNLTDPAKRSGKSVEQHNNQAANDDRAGRGIIEYCPATVICKNGRRCYTTDLWRRRMPSARAHQPWQANLPCDKLASTLSRRIGDVDGEARSSCFESTKTWRIVTKRNARR